MRTKSLTLLIVALIFLSACNPIAGTIEQSTSSNGTPEDRASVYSTESAQVPEASVTSTPIPFSSLRCWFGSAVPEQLRTSFGMLAVAEDEASADIRLDVTDDPMIGGMWIYALTTPFSSLLDNLSSGDLQSAWQGSFTPAYRIYLEQSTFDALQPVLGQPGGNVVVTPADGLLAAAWEHENSLAIVPFEALEPRWKVITIDGQSPVHNDFESNAYPLKVYFGWQGEPEKLAAVEQAAAEEEIPQLVSNRDPSKMTVLVMTGVTALVRATAVKMEANGMTYPGQDVRDWLVNADLTHISNEVSFSPACPDPKPDPMPLVFCSKLEYIELLDYVGTDILELTGNHGVDWGRDALIYSLGLYKDRGWYVYAAGENVEQARDAVLVEHNGNKLAFIGCNPAGPEYIWATATLPGVANCDYPWMWQRIRALTDESFNVISTFQYFETYRHYVEPFEERDFRSMVDAGAVIVSGSQSHHPMAMEFYKGSFIHYGLGNLFFDQMHTGGLIPDATRKEFIDRYVFYNNKHISTELLTAMLEDYSRPRPMTPSERYDFLTEIFAVTNWGDVP